MVSRSGFRRIMAYYMNKGMSKDGAYRAAKYKADKYNGKRKYYNTRSQIFG